jgi:hypothetical protein
MILFNTKRNKYNCFKFKFEKKRKWSLAKIRKLAIKNIYIRIIKHYTDINPADNTRPRIFPVYEIDHEQI